LTRIALTGVTALVRATAYNMEQNGILWPGEDVAPVLQAADFAHASNEVSFAPDCPYPNPIGGTTFCSRDSYFELLTHLGIDLMELTGNHLNDWGADNLSCAPSRCTKPPAWSPMAAGATPPTRRNRRC
jgi:hypothetical protein